MRVLVVLLPLVLSGCGIFDFLNGSQLDELRRNRQRWEALEIRSYDYEHRKSCFCQPVINQRVRVEVRNGVVTRTVNIATGEEVSDPYITWPTIDELFDQTEHLLGTDYKLKITYDPALYFPARVSGDVPRALDDEFTTTAENLVQR